MHRFSECLFYLSDTVVYSATPSDVKYIGLYVSEALARTYYVTCTRFFLFCRYIWGACPPPPQYPKAGYATGQHTLNTVIIMDLPDLSFYELSQTLRHNTKKNLNRHKILWLYHIARMSIFEPKSQLACYLCKYNILAGRFIGLHKIRGYIVVNISLV